MKSFIRRLPLGVKLMLVGIIPLLFIIFLSFQLYQEKSNKVDLLAGYIQRIEQDETIHALIDNLQKELKLSFDFIVKKDPPEQLVSQRVATDKAIETVGLAYNNTLPGFSNYTFLNKLRELRSKIDRNEIRPGDITDYYTNASMELANGQKNLWQYGRSHMRNMLKSEEREKYITLAFILLSSVIIISIVSYVLNIISQMLKELEVAAEKLSRGATGVDIKIVSNDTIGHLARSIAHIDATNEVIANAAESIGRGKFNIPIKSRGAEDRLGNAILRMKEDFELHTREKEEKLWMHAGIETISKSLIGDKDVNELGKDSLQALASYLDCGNACFFVTSDASKKFILVHELDKNSAWGDYAEIRKEDAFTLNRGKNEILYQPISNPPHKAGITRHEYIVPLSVYHSLEGAIKLMTTAPLPPAALNLLKEVQTSIAGTLQAAKSRALLQDLYEETQTQTQELEELTHTIQGLMQKKDEFFSIASHELKTPITTIKGSLQIIQRVTAEHDQMKMLLPFVEKADKQVNKLTTLVTHLLDVTKIQAGKLELQKTEFNVRDLISESIDQMQYSLDGHEIIIEGNADQVIYADKFRLEQVLINLLTNAVKYSPGQKEILLVVEEVNGHLKISVTDYGIGIKPSRIPFIFERFYRIEESTQVFSGLGLGLYISSEIIKQHKGQIVAESKQGVGSTFWFTVPSNPKI